VADLKADLDAGFAAARTIAAANAAK